MTSDARRKCGKLRYAITYNVIWVNQKTEYFKYHWLRALAMFDLTSLSPILSGISSSVDTLIENKVPCEFRSSYWSNWSQTGPFIPVAVDSNYSCYCTLPCCEGLQKSHTCAGNKRGLITKRHPVIKLDNDLWTRTEVSYCLLLQSQFIIESYRLTLGV